MKHLLKYLLAAAALLLWGQAAAAGPFGQLRGLCEPGKSVLLTAPTVVEGIVVSDFHSKNMEANPSVSYDKVDVTVNDCTAYLESPDGRYGFRLRFDTPEDNVLARGTRLSLSLSGTVLTREENPERYTISSLVGENMVESVAGEAIPVKQRRISELTDDDVYTFVSLENTEFLFKEGSYANVYENYSLSSDVNASQTGNNNRMDGWASLLMDDAGNSIYAPVNMLCLWRRSGQGVPQGTGTTRHRGAQRIAALRQRGALPDPRARRVGLRHGMGRGVGLYGVCRMGRQPSQILVRDLCQVQQPVCL